MILSTPHPLNCAPPKCSCRSCDVPICFQSAATGLMMVSTHYSSPPRMQHKHRSIKAHAVNKHKKQLVDRVLQNQAGIPQAVLQGVHAISSSVDWHQLQAAFATPAAQLRAAAVPAQGSRRHQQPPQQRGSGGGSPWGFALRQPGSQRSPALNPISTSSSSPQPSVQPEGQSPSPPSQHNSPATAVQEGRGQQPSWQLEGAQQLVLLGLGSISALLTSSNSSNSSSSSGQAAAPSRLGYRLMQLALAVALQQHLLTGATKKPLVYDPGFEPEDVDLLEGLGFEVAGCEPSHTVSCPTLFYMPCCPRQLYSDVLGANWQQLHQVAILGTSMRSLSDTQSLFSALVQESEAEADTPPSSRISSSIPGMSAAGSSTAADRADVSSLLTAEIMQQQQQQQVSLQQQQQVVVGVDVVSQAYSEGRVLEVVCPDFSAHGVGVSLHLFHPEQKRQS